MRFAVSCEHDAKRTRLNGMRTCDIYLRIDHISTGHKSPGESKMTCIERTNVVQAPQCMCDSLEGLPRDPLGHHVQCAVGLCVRHLRQGGRRVNAKHVPHTTQTRIHTRTMCPALRMVVKVRPWYSVTRPPTWPLTVHGRFAATTGRDMLCSQVIVPVTGTIASTSPENTRILMPDCSADTN